MDRAGAQPFGHSMQRRPRSCWYLRSRAGVRDEWILPGRALATAPMIRTGYLRWEIEAEDRRSEADTRAREVVLRARPTFRIVRVKNQEPTAAAERFVQGEVAYDDVLRAARIHYTGAEV